jgi:hypothetical protein
VILARQDFVLPLFSLVVNDICHCYSYHPLRVEIVDASDIGRK